MTHPKKLIAGNWKMNGLRASAGEVAAMVAGAADLPPSVELAICPPATLAAFIASQVQNSAIAVGGQDCHAQASGAFTGDVSAEMWADLGAKYVIVGHSERRAVYGETDEAVAAKAAAVLRAGLTPIICVGETLAERDSGKTVEIVCRQLEGSLPGGVQGGQVVIAYEPVWAIGTGRTPTTAQVAEVHASLRQSLTKLIGPTAAATRLLYGGSVKPDNAAELMHVPDVDGALVGGASLKAKDFLAIAKAAG